MSATGSFLVKTANKANAAALQKLIPDSIESSGQRCYRAVAKLAQDLGADEKDVIWELFALNMEGFYKESQMGWDPESKKKELFNRWSRFILVRDQDDAVVAYTMFRFEYEDGSNLVYCYELQVSPEHKRQGLGRTLMGLLKSIGKEYAMDKVVLTVFKGNQQGIDFYTTGLGFSSDTSCPGYEEEDPSVDYRILALEL